MDERMDSLWTVKRFAKWKYETDEPTKAQVNVVSRQCKNGILPARKVGNEWRIDVGKVLEVFDG